MTRPRQENGHRGAGLRRRNAERRTPRDRTTGAAKRDNEATRSTRQSGTTRTRQDGGTAKRDDDVAKRHDARRGTGRRVPRGRTTGDAKRSETSVRSDGYDDAKRN